MGKWLMTNLSEISFNVLFLVFTPVQNRTSDCSKYSTHFLPAHINNSEIGHGIKLSVIRSHLALLGSLMGCNRGFICALLSQLFYCDPGS